MGLCLEERYPTPTPEMRGGQTKVLFFIRRRIALFSTISWLADDPGHYVYLHISLATLRYSEAVLEVKNASSRELARSQCRARSHRREIMRAHASSHTRSQSRFPSQNLSSGASKVKYVVVHTGRDHPHSTMWSRTVT